MAMKRIFFISMLLLFSACAPVMETTYQFIPPESAEGKACVNNCLLPRGTCLNQCRRLEDACEENERLRAENDYLIYSNQQRALGRDVSRYGGGYDYSYRCADTRCADECETTHRLCYSNCGGLIKAQTRCTAFCD